MNLILELFFPKRCVGCRVFGTYFCQKCVSSIKQTDLVCPKCERASIGGVVHPICKRKYGLDGLWSLGVYKQSFASPGGEREDPLREAIKQLKYRWVKEVAESLIDILLEYWAKYQPFIFEEIKKDQGKKWIIAPVPLHWRRENERGFNQSALLGKLLAQKLGLKYSETLKRVKFTKPQVTLKGFARHQNIKNAFSLSPNYSLSPVICCLLIDDVWTTGSTLKECCFVLKKNGTKKVWALTLAR